eukprot:g70740.t1
MPPGREHLQVEAFRTAHATSKSSRVFSPVGMGVVQSGLGGPPDQVSRCQKSYPQFLVDVANINQWSSMYANPHTGEVLFFQAGTTLGDDTLAGTTLGDDTLVPYLWNFRDFVLIAVTKGKPLEAAEQGNAYIKLKKQTAVLSVREFYTVFVFMRDHLDLLRQKRNADVGVESDLDLCQVCPGKNSVVACSCLHAYCQDCVDQRMQNGASAPCCIVCKASLEQESSWMDVQRPDGEETEEVWTVLNRPSTEQNEEFIKQVQIFPHFFVQTKFNVRNRWLSEPYGWSVPRAWL